MRSGVLIALAAAVLVTGVLVERPDPATRPAAARSPVEAFRRWTELPLPPESRTGSTFVWAGTELVLWGGCDPAVDDDCRETSDGFSFDPAAEAWKQIPEAPIAGSFGHSAWTGTEAIFVTKPRDGGRLVAQSYRPATETWAALPAPPLKSVGEMVWTGTDVLAWSEGTRARPRVWPGAAYDLATGEWRPVADAPFALSLVSGAWTGTEVVLYGSLLDRRHWAETDNAVGAAYSPMTDSWRILPKSKLSPYATSAALVGNQFVAWDYETDYQVYDVVLDEWSKPKRMPLQFSECYPDSAVVRGSVFAFFCGRAAVYDPATASWDATRGGPLGETTEAHGRSYELWRFASMASSGEAVYLLMEGITVNRNGVPCYGCPGAPRSFWSFRPRLSR